MQTDSSREKAKLVGEKPASLPDSGPEALYIGKGAYTGMIDDPVMIDDSVKGETLIQRTKRVIDPSKDRWHPGADALSPLKSSAPPSPSPQPSSTTLLKDPWGLIERVGSERGTDKEGKPNRLKALKEGGLGQLPEEIGKIDEVRIGYIHGMTAAIAKCVAVGPWSTPYELAAGTETTKMASCFACTTYMYANGFPPSSTHLGRGESWVPPKSGLLSGELEENYMPEYLKVASINDPLIARWNWDIYHYLRLGGKYLSLAISLAELESKQLENADITKEKINYVNPNHHDAVRALNAKLKVMKGDKNCDIGKVGGNLFLDALTVHDSDWKRVKRTLEPVYNKYFYTTEKARLNREIDAGNILVPGKPLKIAGSL
jgi:hypothetical protein